MKTIVKQQGRIRRPCGRCEEYFTPITKHTKICEACVEKSMLARIEKGVKWRELQKENAKEK